MPGLLHSGATYELETTESSASESTLVLRSILPDSFTRKLFHGSALFSHSASLLKAQAAEREELLPLLCETITHLAEERLHIPACLEKLPKFDAPVLKGVLWSFGIAAVQLTLHNYLFVFTVAMHFATQVIWTSYLVRVSQTTRQLTKGTFPIPPGECVLNGAIGPAIFSALLLYSGFAIAAILTQIKSYIPISQSTAEAFLFTALLCILCSPLFLSAILNYRLVRAIKHVAQNCTTVPAPGPLSAILILSGSMFPSFAFFMNIKLEPAMFPLALGMLSIVQLFGWMLSFMVLKQLCRYIRAIAVESGTTAQTDASVMAGEATQSNEQESTHLFDATLSVNQSKAARVHQKLVQVARVWKSYSAMPPASRIGLTVMLGLVCFTSLELADQTVQFLSSRIVALVTTVLAVAYVCRSSNPPLAVPESIHTNTATPNATMSKVRHQPDMGDLLLSFYDKVFDPPAASKRPPSLNSISGALTSLPVDRRLGVLTLSALMFVVGGQLIVNCLAAQGFALLLALVALPLGKRLYSCIRRLVVSAGTHCRRRIPGSYYIRFAKLLIFVSLISVALETGLYQYEEAPLLLAESNLLTKEERLVMYDAAIDRKKTPATFIAKAKFLASLGLVDEQLETLRSSRSKIDHDVVGEIELAEIEALKNANQLEEAQSKCRSLLHVSKSLTNKKCEKCGKWHETIALSPTLRARLYEIYADLCRDAGKYKEEQESRFLQVDVVSSYQTWFAEDQ